MTAPTWLPVITASAPNATIASTATLWSDRQIAEFRAQLENDPELSDSDRTTIMEFAAPAIRTHTLEAILAGWLALQPVQ